MPRVNAAIFTIIDLSTLVGFSVLMLALRTYAAYPDAPEQVQSAYRVTAEVIYQYIYELVSPFIAIMIGLSVALMSWAMRKGDFASWTAYLGFAVAAVSIIGGAD